MNHHSNILNKERIVIECLCGMEINLPPVMPGKALPTTTCWNCGRQYWPLPQHDNTENTMEDYR